MKSVAASGSSPRGRGKLALSARQLYAQRLIPARAGKTGSGGGSTRRSTAHPRAGGENDQGAPDHGWPVGSSPRGRGKPGSAMRPVMVAGLIPARAGKTRRRLCLRLSPRAHPRAGGENGGVVEAGAGGGGSSPRGRGKPSRIPVMAVSCRLIPARAGKTRPCSSSTRARRAHPRAGGENLLFGAKSGPQRGSSPRGRGKPTHPQTEIASHGLIPARAGKTEAGARAFADEGAHPRAGGENGMKGASSLAPVGSSPRGRGKRNRGGGGCHRNRLIPARAGKTPST